MTREGHTRVTFDLDTKLWHELKMKAATEDKKLIEIVVPLLREYLQEKNEIPS